MLSSSRKTSYSLKLGTITLQHKATPGGLFVEDVIATFGTRSQSALVLFFTLPFVQPIPLIGLSTPIGLLLICFGFLIMLNKPLWLPNKILRKHLSAKLIISCCTFLIRILSKTEKLIKPRIPTLTTHRATKVVNGLLIMIFAFLLALPLPIPFSNSIPAWFLVLNALSELEEDGFLMLVSYGVAIFGFLFFIGIGVGVDELFRWSIGRV